MNSPTYDRVIKAAQETENNHLFFSIQQLRYAFKLYRPEEIYLSFNGGKDATIAVHLARIAYQQVFPEAKDPVKLNAVYFEENDSFSEVEQFINDMEKELNLILYRFPAKSYHNLKELVEKNSLKAIIMGSRKDDPNCSKLNTFTPSDIDKGFQPFMRINPVLQWTYKQVWNFLREYEIPYCSLYDQGYTYLGNKETSQKNEALKNPNGGYSPAYTCLDEYETESRIENSNKEKEEKKTEF